MRSMVWVGSAMAALLFAVVAIVALRERPLPARPVPPAATLAAAADRAGIAHPAVTPSFDIVRIDPQGHAVIAGRAAPGDKVRVLDGGKAIGEVKADGRGEWVLLPEAPMAVGSRQLSIEATGGEGGPPRRSSDTVALSVLPLVSPDRGATALAVLLPGDAGGAPRVLQRPPGAARPEGLSIDSADYGAARRLVLAGHAEPGTRVAIYAGSEKLGTVTADPEGKWSLASPHVAPARSVELRLEQLAADGSVARRITQPFEPATATATVGTDPGTYVVQSGNNLWLIARQLYGEGTRYTVIYTANRAQIRDPDRIYPGQVFKLPHS